MKKLIFFDIDGTLIGKGTQIPAESTKAAVRKARENGHICVVNTGRTWRMVGGWLPQQMEFDGYLLGCGTAVRYRDELLLHKTFSEETARRIMDALDRYGMDALLEGNDDNYARKLTEFRWEIFRDHMERRHTDDCKPWEDAPGHFDKLFLHEGEAWRIESFRREMEEELEFIDRERGFWEIAPKGYSKGSAIRFLAERLGIPMEYTVAIGDSSNDLEMLRCAGTAIAMGNAVGAVKDIADYITTSVTEDGIRNALEWLKVI